MDVSVTIIISAVSCLCAILSAFSAYKARTTNDSEDEGRAAGTLLTAIGYIKSGIDDLKRQQEKAEERYVELTKRLAMVEASVKQAHRRLDDYLKGEK